jgi:hypothetical protein
MRVIDANRASDACKSTIVDAHSVDAVALTPYTNRIPLSSHAPSPTDTAPIGADAVEMA